MPASLTTFSNAILNKRQARESLCQTPFLVTIGLTLSLCIVLYASKKLSGLSIYHENIRGINNKIEELLTQWETNQPHVLSFTEHHLTKPEITCTLIESSNLGTYFCRKFKKNGGVSIFVHQNLQFTPTDLDEFCTDQEIEICAVKLHNFSTNIYILTI
jgi:hypothetical protein